LAFAEALDADADADGDANADAEMAVVDATRLGAPLSDPKCEDIDLSKKSRWS
jgi:hypothetical protein